MTRIPGWNRWGWYWHLAGWAVLAGTVIGPVDGAFAQITPDTTLGNESSTVTSTSEGDLINGGATRGINLFHSFREFNIGEGRVAYFTNPAGVENILTRVTGANSSNIFGTLGVTGGNANLFLINPNGIIFGPNARLDVGGSFVGTTASGVLLEETGRFSSTEPQTSNLLTIKPSALFFNAMGTGRIVNQSQGFGSRGETNSRNAPVGLQVPPGQTLSLVGGNVFLEGGNLTAVGGRIELGSVAGTGEVSLSQTGNAWVFGYDEINTFGTIQIQDGAFVDVSGSGGGDIQIQAARLMMTGRALLFANTLGSEDGGEVLVHTTEVVTLSDGSLLTANASSLGAGGNLRIETGQLVVQDGAQISSSTRGDGDGGALTVKATESVQLVGESADGRSISGLFTQTEGKGAAGALSLETGQLLVRDGALLSTGTRGDGDGGALTVKATESVQVIGTSADGRIPSGLFTQTEGKGAAGALSLETGQLLVRDGAQISSSTFGDGDGGALTVKATESVQLVGESADGRIPSGLFTQTEGKGAAGALSLETGQLLVRDGAQIIAGTRGDGDGGALTVKATESVQLVGESADGQIPSGLFTQTEGKGAAGALSLETGQLLMRDGALLSTGTFSGGQGGSLKVKASESVELSGTSANGRYSSGLFTGTRGAGNAGDLMIETGQLTVQDGAEITASTLSSGQGGTLTINASESVELAGTSATDISSGLFVQTGGPGKAGRIALTSPHINIHSGARIEASTSGGAGGSITITGNILEVTEGGQVATTTSSSNNAGDINIFIQDRLLLSGTNSGVFANTTEESSGNGGSILIDPRTVIVRDGASITVSSQGTGTGGNINLLAGFLNLDNNAAISAETASSTGGNISLELQDILLLRRGSQISATAGTAQQAGNGGDITITVSNGFIIAGASENNDITANAFSGTGGRVTINAAGVFGITPRSRNDLAQRLGTNLDPQQLPTNDITAISQTSPSLSGQVTVTGPEVDPSQGLVSLPAVPVEAEVTQACAPTPGGTQAQSEFVVTGRGGLPPAPTDALSIDAVEVDWVALDSGLAGSSSTTPVPNLTSAKPAPIVEAQGWVTNQKGEVLLVATAPTEPQIQPPPTHCPTP